MHPKLVIPFFVESTLLGKLEAAGYINVEKAFVGKKPHTMLRITEKGRVAFQEYRKSMKQIFEDLPT